MENKFNRKVKTMEFKYTNTFRYTTSFGTYDKDFDKAVADIPDRFYEEKNLKVQLIAGQNLKVKEVVEIAQFIINSFEYGDVHKVELTIDSNESLTDEVEVILSV